ncbi:MAG: hypothetical protein U9O65_00215 [Thermotogota bacterium]|nr:hypothetical protein [Thermotogota bacterium]
MKKADHKTAVIWACECAERVLSYFEEKYPDDNRPRKSIDTGRSAAHAASTVHVKKHVMIASTYATKAVFFIITLMGLP